MKKSIRNGFRLNRILALCLLLMTLAIGSVLEAQRPSRKPSRIGTDNVPLTFQKNQPVSRTDHNEAALPTPAKRGSNKEQASVTLPDHRYTPGATRTTNVHDVCSQKAQTFRHTDESLKRQVCREYGAKDCPDPKKGEIDHLIPLTLGGADTLTNLWWQPSPDYKAKDKLEVRLHELVCSGKMPLGEAQHGIATDWNAMYGKVMK